MLLEIAKLRRNLGGFVGLLASQNNLVTISY
jgi:hypothetical protein